MSACNHARRTIERDRAYTGVERSGRIEGFEAACGGVVDREQCEDCGRVRYTVCNCGRREQGRWVQP